MLLPLLHQPGVALQLPPQPPAALAPRAQALQARAERAVVRDHEERGPARAGGHEALEQAVRAVELAAHARGGDLDLHAPAGPRPPGRPRPGLGGEAAAPALEPGLVEDHRGAPELRPQQPQGLEGADQAHRVVAVHGLEGLLPGAALVEPPQRVHAVHDQVRPLGLGGGRRGPGCRSASPMQASASPGLSGIFSRQASASPGLASTSSGHASASSRQARASSGQATASSRQASASSRQASAAPRRPRHHSRGRQPHGNRAKPLRCRSEAPGHGPEAAAARPPSPSPAPGLP
mmetsp:Transcript_6109/g.17441  ORF Transcript_6109/g.17441 Transcript_6109/m.17441 type:complete len:292 (-) Transcript_6109:8-883(-)